MLKLFCLIFINTVTYIVNSDVTDMPMLSSGFHFCTVYDGESNNSNIAFYNEILPHLGVYQLGLTWFDAMTNTSINNINSTYAIFLPIIHSFLNLQPLVGISVINTNVLSIPSDLVSNNMLINGMNFTNNIFLYHYFKFLDKIIPLVVQNGGFYVGLANELDAYLPFQSNEYQQSFVQFVLLAKDYIQNTLNYPNLAVGVTVISGKYALFLTILYYSKTAIILNNIKMHLLDTRVHHGLMI